MNGINDKMKVESVKWFGDGVGRDELFDKSETRGVVFFLVACFIKNSCVKLDDYDVGCYVTEKGEICHVRHERYKRFSH